MSGVWIALVLAAAGLLLFRIRPVWGLAGAIVLIPFDLALTIGGITVHTNEAYLAGAGLGVLGRLGLNALRWQEAGRCLWPFGVFLAVTALSMTVASDTAAAFRQTLRWAEFALVLLMARTVPATRAEVDRLLTLLLSLGVLTALLGLVQHFAHLAPASGVDQMHQITDQVRAYATFGHANQFAGFLVLLLPLALALLLENGSRHGRLAWSAVLLVLSAALVLTYSRSGWVCAGLALLAVASFTWSRHARTLGVLAAVGLGLVLGLFWAGSGLDRRVASLTRFSEDSAVTGRWVYQRLAWQEVLKRPVLGYGAGNYLRAIDPLLQAMPAQRPYLEKHIHNLYTQLALESGLLGLVAFLGFLGVTVARYLGRRGPLPRPRDGTLVAAFLAAGLAFALQNTFDVLVVYARGIHFALILGLGLAYLALAEREGPATLAPEAL